MQVQVIVSVGEMLDKVSILEIKAQRIRDNAKLENVRRELELLGPQRDSVDVPPATMADWRARLAEVNGQLWDIEDKIRVCESKSEFGDEFVALARAVYKTNDIRADIKREINRVTGSDVVEEKSYEDY